MRLPALLMVCSALLSAAPDWVLVRTTDGTEIEGQASVSALGKAPVLSFHSGTPLSQKETERVQAGLAAIQGKDRPARDAAVEELTAIGVPVVTPLLQVLKDTDQHASAAVPVVRARDPE